MLKLIQDISLRFPQISCFFVVFLASCVTNVFGPHPRTQNLSCYYCSSLDDSGCEKIYVNNTYHSQKVCHLEEIYCSVMRLEFTSLTGEERTFWSVERNCSKICQEGCIVMGERTKLYLCRSCCRGHLCNIGDSGNNIRAFIWLVLINCLCIISLS